MLVIKQMWSINISVVTAQGSHLFPFRTEKLSPAAPMVLRKSGRVGRRRSLEKDISFAGILFLFVALWGHKLPGLKSRPEGTRAPAAGGVKEGDGCDQGRQRRCLFRFKNPLLLRNCQNKSIFMSLFCVFRAFK